MTYALGTPSTVIPNFNLLQAAVQKQVADVDYKATATSGASQDLGVGCQYFRAVVSGKTITLGSGTEAHFWLEVADNTGFTSNKRVIASRKVPAVDAPFCLVMDGFAPDGSKQFARVCSAIGTAWTALTADVLIQAFS